METLGNEFVAKSGTYTTSKYYCQSCDYTCCKKYNWEKHLDTSKHKKCSMEIESGNKWQNSGNKFECEVCNRLYATSSGLWKHHQKCMAEEEIKKPIADANEPTDKDLIMLLIKENSELKNMMMKVLENGTMQNSHNTTTNTNSHNKAFNLQFFLNETCKDAMNISDFVESIKLQLSDLERVGELGYVEGISNIIVKNLKDLDVTQRPVHCTDQKRETMYVKDENTWEKDEEQKKMHKLVRKVADKNARMLPKFKEAHPDCGKSSSRYSDQYNKIIMEAMGGRGDNDFEKEEKIIKKVSKEVTVEKNPL
jgi:hypothetical protein